MFKQSHWSLKGEYSSMSYKYKGSSIDTPLRHNVIPSGSHHCWKDVCSMKWKVCPTLLHDWAGRMDAAWNKRFTQHFYMDDLGGHMQHEMKSLPNTSTWLGRKDECSMKWKVYPTLLHGWVGRTYAAWNEKFAQHFYMAGPRNQTRDP